MGLRRGSNTFPGVRNYYFEETQSYHTWEAEVGRQGKFEANPVYI